MLKMLEVLLNLDLSAKGCAEFLYNENINKAQRMPDNRSDRLNSIKLYTFAFVTTIMNIIYLWRVDDVKNSDTRLYDVLS